MALAPGAARAQYGAVLTGTGAVNRSFAGVATVLHFAAGLPYLVAFGSVAASELVLLLVGNALLVRRFRPDVG